MNRSDSFYEPHFHFILTPEDLKRVNAVRQIVEAIPVQLLLVLFNFGLQRTAYDPGVISQNGAQHAFLGFANLEGQVVDKNGGFNF
jgi:hypothetical protein